MAQPLDFARADVGLRSEGGRFRGPPEKYNLAVESPAAWCARACRTWHALAGITLPAPTVNGKLRPDLLGSVKILHDALVDAGMFLPPTTTPQPNDLILLEGTAGNRDGLLIGGHHVALVETVTPTFVQSIDGDWGTPDRVERVTRERTASDIWGYGRVPGANGGGAGSLLMKGALAFGAYKGARYALRWWRQRHGPALVIPSPGGRR